MSANDEEKQKKISEDADREMVRLWRTWKTVNELLQDRVGYPKGNPQMP